MRGLIDDVQKTPNAPRDPEMDSCCGHDKFKGLPYDSELKTCCIDGKIREFREDGEDPCPENF